MVLTFLESTVRKQLKEMIIIWSCCFNGRNHVILWEYLEMKETQVGVIKEGLPEKLMLELNLK